MRLTVKRWGNGLAVRLPRTSPELGRIEEGTELEANFRPIKDTKDWRPVTVRSGIRDGSIRHDELAWGYLDDKFGPGSPRWIPFKTSPRKKK